MTLRIAWASPWNTRSAIATFGLGVTAALVEAGHHVDILRTEVAESLDLPTLPSGLSVQPIADVPPHRIPLLYDALILNLGDHFGYHGAALPYLPAMNACVVFHDAYLANFCAGWASTFPGPDAAQQAMVRSAYGPEAISAGAPYWLDPAEMMRSRPMIELFARDALGAVVHADHYRGRVQAACPGPVATIPLSFADLGVAVPGPAGSTFTVATIGHVNPNKQVGQVIAALGASPILRERCTYLVIGPIEPAERERLEADMRIHGVPAVEFTGWLDDDALRARLARVDAICCLRNPILEGGSASVIVAMLSGRPVLVSDHGVYAELPADVVLKCTPGAEAADVRRHLEGVLVDPAAALALGARARTYAQRRHGPAHYARQLLDLVQQAQSGAPALRTAMQFGQVLASIGLSPSHPGAAAVATVLQQMRGAPAR